MKEIFLIYSKFCISSKKALSLIESISKNDDKVILHKILFSFNDSLVKKHNIKITPTFIIDDKIAFVGIPEKNDLLAKIN